MGYKICLARLHPRIQNVLHDNRQCVTNLQSTYLSHVIAAIRKQTKMLSQRVAG